MLLDSVPPENADSLAHLFATQGHTAVLAWGLLLVTAIPAQLVNTEVEVSRAITALVCVPSDIARARACVKIALLPPLIPYLSSFRGQLLL